MITFEEENHVYRDGDIIVPSVSQILAKVFGTGYDQVPENILKSACEKGKIVHEEIEMYEKNGTRGFTSEFSRYFAMKKNIGFKVVDMEQMVYSKNNIVNFAGRYDIALTDKLADIKTTYKLDVEKTIWQLSLYNYALGMKYKQGAIIWLREDKQQFRVVELKSKEEVEELLTNYVNDEATSLVKLESLTVKKASDIKKYLARIKVLEQRMEEFKTMLHDEMKSRGLKKYDDGEMMISFVDEMEEQTIDTKLLKVNYPLIYKELSKTVKVKSSIRIKLKGGINENYN